MLIKKLIPAIGWFIVSLILLCLPGSAIPKYPWLSAIYADKWVHIFMFGMLSFLFCSNIHLRAVLIKFIIEKILSTPAVETAIVIMKITTSCIPKNCADKA